MARNRRGFGIVSTNIILDQSLSTTDKAVYAALAVHADAEGVCFPRVGTIAAGLGVTERTVMRSMERLCAAGWVERTYRFREDGGQQSSLYHLNDFLTRRGHVTTGRGGDTHVGAAPDTNVTHNKTISNKTPTPPEPCPRCDHLPAWCTCQERNEGEPE